MQPSRQEPAAIRAYRELERLIVTLELAPGSVATESMLIARLALGRTPVREAIQRLAWEGIVLYEVISTTNEFTIIVNDDQVDNAFRTIKDLKTL